MLYLSTQTDDYRHAAELAVQATGDLDEVLSSLAASLDPRRAEALLEFNKALDLIIEDAATRQTDLDKLTRLMSETAPLEGVDLASAEVAKNIAEIYGLSQDQQQFLLTMFDTNRDLVLSYEELGNAVQFYQENLDRLSGIQADTVAKDVAHLLTLNNVDIEKATAQIREWMDQLEAGTISGEEFVQKVHEAASSPAASGLIYSSSEAAAASRDLASSQVEAGEAIQDTQAAIKAQVYMYGASGSVIAQYTESQRDAADATDDATKAAEEQTKVLENQASTVGQTTSVISSYQEGQRDSWGYTVAVTAALAKQTSALGMARDAIADARGETETANVATDQWTAAIAIQADRASAAQSAIAGYADALGQVPGLESNSAAGFAARATQAGSALGDAFRVAVGNTNQIGSQSQQVADWAKELINVKNETGKIDDLLARGVITQDEYNAAQAAGTSIFAANAAIQDDILKIQTDQAPLLARLTDEQQRYMDHLADLPAEQQLVRLGFMDSTEAMKAQQAVALAAAAASGELGAAGKESAQQIIAGAAEADPALRAMLESLHLIKVDSDTGEITVDFSQVDDAGASLDDVVNVLKDLRDVIAEAFNIAIDSNAGSQADDLQLVVNLLNELNGKSVTYYVSAAGNGVSLGSPTGPTATPELHGGVVGYVHGGTVRAEMAEVDPELVHLAGGGLAIAPRHGIYQVPRGSFVENAPATRSALAALGGPSVQVVINGNVYGMDDLVDQVTDHLVPALALAAQQHFAAYGVAQ